MHALLDHALVCLVKHQRREIDAGDVAVRRVQRRVDAGADANFENLVAGLDAHAVERDESSRMERGTEGQVVNLGNLVVDAFDEVILDSGNRQRACGSVGAEISVFSFEQRHSRAPSGPWTDVCPGPVSCFAD